MIPGATHGHVRKSVGIDGSQAAVAKLEHRAGRTKNSGHQDVDWAAVARARAEGRIPGE